MASHNPQTRTSPRSEIKRAPVVLVVDAYSRSSPTCQRATMLAAALQAPLVVTGRTVPAGIPPQLVILGESSEVASRAFELLDHLDAPILIARAPKQGGSIVASSDLRRAKHPVLREAVRLGRLLGKRVTFVHNVGRLAEGSGTHVLPMHETATYLRLIAMHSRCDATAVVMSEHDTATAILEVAALDGTDVVVVGHHPRTGPADRERDVAAAVIERCTATVLLVPLQARFA